MGGALGMSSAQVRAETPTDFEDLVDGWVTANGGDTGPDMSDDAIADLEALMERYPDG